MGSPKRLTRTSSVGRIAGVCAGIAEYLDADVTLVRLVWVVLSIVPAASSAAWSPISPPGPSWLTRATPRRRTETVLTRSTTDQKIAGVWRPRGISTSIQPWWVIWAILTIIPGCIVLASWRTRRLVHHARRAASTPRPPVGRVKPPGRPRRAAGRNLFRARTIDIAST